MLQKFRNSLGRILAEPTVHFLILGGFIFAAHAVFGDSGEKPEADRIVVDPATVEQVTGAFERRHDRAPSAEEKRAAVRDWIQREMLVRKAIDAGMHRVDPIVRRRLAQAMKFGVGQTPPSAAPDREALRTYYRDHRNRYRRPAKFAFRHVYLRDCDATDNRQACDERAREILRALRSGASPTRFGAPFVHGREFASAAPREIAEIFGAPFARRLESLRSGEWAGPLESDLGVHLVRISERTPPELPELDDIEEKVRRDYRNDSDTSKIDRAVETIRDEYWIDLQADLRLGEFQ